MDAIVDLMVGICIGGGILLLVASVVVVLLPRKP